MAVPRELTRPIAPQALPISGALGLLALIALGAGWLWGAGGALGLAVANAAFFRNPRRKIPPGENAVGAPADGRVVAVIRMDDPDGFVGPAWKISIFLSILDVHINRVPFTGTVRATRRSGARYLAAFRGDASRLNVQLRMDIESASGARVSVTQITGLIARRIVCYASEGGTLERGEPYGLLCYGSRMDVIVPGESRILVRRGDRVRGGRTILAEVQS